MPMVTIARSMLHVCMDGLTDAWMHGSMRGCAGAWMHGCMDTWMCGCTDARMHGFIASYHIMLHRVNHVP